MALSAYLQQTQRLLGDQTEQFFNLADLIAYINAGRNKIAAATQSVRAIPKSSGSLATVTVNTQGTGYTSPPTVTVSAPDAYGFGYTQATVTASVAGGHITGFTITNAGTGYVNPTITITGGGGTGGVANFTLTGFLSCIANQEVYNFSTASQYLPSGYASVIAVQTVAVSWGSEKPVLRWMDWSGFQAYLRSLNMQSTNWPSVWTQYAQGVNGSIYVYPVPSQIMQMEWDCYCLPIPLVDDSTVEALPYPWTEAVPYYAAHQAAISASQPDRANYFEAKYRQAMTEGRDWVSPAMVPDFYEGPF
jgi:hypothetical protein